MQLTDWALLALIALTAALAVRKIIRDRRAGKCCGNCAGCAARCSTTNTAYRTASRTARRGTTGAVRCDTAGAESSPQSTNDRAG